MRRPNPQLTETQRLTVHMATVPELDSEAAVSAGDNCDEQSFTPRVGLNTALENTYSNTKDMNDAS